VLLNKEADRTLSHPSMVMLIGHIYPCIPRFEIVFCSALF